MEDDPPPDLPDDPGASYNPALSRVAAVPLTTPRPPAAPTRLTSPRPFVLREQVGAGGVGEVWSAVQTSLGRVVAVKRLRDSVSDLADVDLDGMFRHEAIVTAHLEHPNVVPVHDLSADEQGRPLLAMKLVRGDSWDEALRRDRGLPASELLARHLPVLRSVAHAVAFAHAHGVVHRDLKPAQVMLGEFGEVLLVDWGLALVLPEAPRTLQAGAGEGGRSETATSPAGTPAFMAPEQTRATAADVGPWTDVYLLGGILYQLLTGSAPHSSGKGRRAFDRAREGIVERPEDRAPGLEIDAGLARLAMSCLERDTALRPTVRQLIAGIDDYLTGASRHAEAGRLLDEVRGLLAPPDRGYRELNEALERLGRARSLWAEAPDWPACQAELLSACTAAALERGDRGLARHHAEQLPEGPVRTSLLARVEAADALALRHARQRRLALGSVAVLALALLGAGLFVLRTERAARARVAEQRERAEELLTFMLQDLRGGLQPLGRLDLLAGLTGQADAYYRSQQLADLGPGGRRQRALAFHAIAQVQHDRGDLAAAQASQEAAIGALRELQASAPGDASTQVALLEVLLDRARTLADQGREQQALEAHAEVRAAAEAALADPSIRSSAASVLVQSIDGAGIVHYDRQRLEPARRAFQEAEDLAGKHGLPPGERTGPSYRSGVVLSELGQHEEALAAFTRAVAHSEQDLREHPRSAAVHGELAFVRTLQAGALRKMGRSSEARALLERALAFGEGAVAKDPTNAETRYGLAQTALELGDVEHAERRPERARQHWKLAADTMAPVSASSTNSYFVDAHVRALLRLGQLAEARPMAERLLAQGWTHQGFQELAEAAGVRAAR